MQRERDIVVADVQPADQRRPVGIGPLEHLEQLPRRGLAKRGDDPLADAAWLAELEASVVRPEQARTGR